MATGGEIRRCQSGLPMAACGVIPLAAFTTYG